MGAVRGPARSSAARLRDLSRAGAGRPWPRSPPLVPSNAYLAADVVRDALGVAVGVHEVEAADAQARARRPGRVVDPAVDDVAAVARLVPRCRSERVRACDGRATGARAIHGPVSARMPECLARAVPGARAKSNAPTRASFSSTATRRSGRRSRSARAVASPTMPAPTTATSTTASRATISRRALYKEAVEWVGGLGAQAAGSGGAVGPWEGRDGVGMAAVAWTDPGSPVSPSAACTGTSHMPGVSAYALAAAL